MIVLGIETSTAVCAAGLFVEGKSEVERSMLESHVHSEKLLTLVQEVVAEASLSLRDVDAVAISSGPGSFTGLRIGFSTAKGLCFALNRPLVTVPTFEAIAVAVGGMAARAPEILVMLDARREEFYVGRFETTKEEVKSLGIVEVLSLQDTLSLARRHPAGLIVTDRVELLMRECTGVRLVEDVHQFCRASVVARLGRRKAMGKEFADVASVEPFYLKDFVVRTAMKTQLS
jgi:tRNA threonylcarbamoyladenosine biosynthesis protein TsaB